MTANTGGFRQLHDTATNTAQSKEFLVGTSKSKKVWGGGVGEGLCFV